MSAISRSCPRGRSGHPRELAHGPRTHAWRAEQIEEKLMDMIDELKIEDWVVVNPLSEVVKSLPGFELRMD